MLDTVIRAGSVIDGTGAQAFTADIGIRDGVIVEIGKISSAARHTIEADGAIVTPGFLDIHSHYDGQFLWDDRLDPSFSHGVTTVLAGYCGVGFAPVKDFHQELMEMMEGVEDIPEAVLNEGLDWNWRSFPDYLDRLAERQYTMDVGSNLAHAPLRVFVMGERALRHEAATADDIEQMSLLVRQAMAAGATGFSNGRITTHASSKGVRIPGTFAEEDELLALAAAMGESGRGVFQIIPQGTNGGAVIPALSRDARLAEHHLIENIARVSGRPVVYTLNEFAADPGDEPMMAEASRKAVANGLQVHPQTLCRGMGAVQMIDSYHVFLRKPSYREVAHLPRLERIAAMRDPKRRSAILSEADVDGEYIDNPSVLKMLQILKERLPKTYILETVNDYEPGPERTVGTLAAAAGKTPEEFIYDHYTSDDGRNCNVSFILNYSPGSLDHVHGMMQDPNVMTGLADGGAHVRMICDASMPTFLMAFWARDRKRGPRLPLEEVIRRMTTDPANLYGFADRGRLAPGMRADLNVIDFPRLSLQPPEIINDLPSGAGRFHQGSVGYLATLVAGQTTRIADEDTGARPGRLLRHGHALVASH
ncbi:N-acyl-D-amino-acid deacylase family protein [Novosphingobium malaysiense]|uniref:Amidohydrolase 3 domain-containing protein n=1 Tax=Novosphingobium malaysiense TaxID=1348853 RepID=A0A0B1ZIE2_9SPHN|nr:amidohydrolase family protein [Novosphingobium malaysiense]KHK88971.1 hypothetical protein LK12_23055 [Novosphingobium malaysiense]